MTLQIPGAALQARSVLQAGVVAWADEQTLSERRAHLRVGQDLQVPARPLASGAMKRLLEPLIEVGQSGWELHPDLEDEANAVGALPIVRGRVGAILAVVVPHRLGNRGVWHPVVGAARCRTVESTCAPEPARSVWIPSGSPVLLGFLVTIQDATFRQASVCTE